MGMRNPGSVIERAQPRPSAAPSSAARSSGPSPARDEPPLPAGAELTPGYTVIDLLDRSRALEVYEVWSEERQCRCVAKMVHRSRRNDDHLVARVLSEGRYLQSFCHPHLVRGYETIDVPSPIVILEAVPGQTLDYLIGTVRRPLPARGLAYLGLHLCSAMQYLHRHDVLHLDLKPSNVVCTHGIAKVLDLSLARPPGEVDAGIGTLGYLPPEQARGGMVTAAADVWGIGSVLYEVATGRRPFEPADRDEEYPQLTGRAPSVRTRRPRLPRPLSRVIDACLEPHPADRPSVAELAATLGRLVPDPGAPLRPAPEQDPAPADDERVPVA
jgi:eukaryotic-like serine/threonine-protein kinase